MERRLAAILAIDVVGYTRLMGEDEAGTHAGLQAHRRELIDPKIAEHHGRIVKLTGDGALVEFASVVNAVECAVGIQRAMAERNTDMPEDRRMDFRIGINLGDIIVEEDDIYGNGVNVAARLQEVAAPGSIAVSDAAYMHLSGKIEPTFDNTGEHKLKNIAKPVRVWQWSPIESIKPLAANLSLAEKPSIAVLPFDNMSGDPDQEYFSDGITDDIISALSKFHWSFVIARSSSFAYRGGSVDAKRIARELGVRYILAGSVRRSANRVRINAQLIDAVADYHLWAERYDREIRDIFEVQDEITQRIVSTVGPELVSAETQRARRKSPDKLDAWDCVMRASGHLYCFAKKDNAEAQRLLQKAVEIHPNSAMAFSHLAMSHLIDVSFGWTEVPAESMAEAERAAKKAIALDDRDAFAYTQLGAVERFQSKFEDAFASFEKALELNPNLAFAYGMFGYALAVAGDSERAVIQINKAIRLSPNDPMMPMWFGILAIAAFVAKRYGEAAEWARKAVKGRPDFAPIHRMLASSCAQSGKLDEARAAIGKVLEAAPHTTLGYVRQIPMFKNQSDMERYLDGLRKAGLPE